MIRSTKDFVCRDIIQLYNTFEDFRCRIYFPLFVYGLVLLEFCYT